MPDLNEDYATIGHRIYNDVLRQMTEADTLGVSQDQRMTQIMETLHRDPEQEEPDFQGLTWSMVSNSPEFKALPLAKKEADRDRFFRDVVLPSVSSLEVDENELRALSWEHIRRTNQDILNPKLNKGGASISPTALRRAPLERMDDAASALTTDSYRWIESGNWAKMRAGEPYEPFYTDYRMLHELPPDIKAYDAEVDELLNHFEQMSTEGGMKWREPRYTTPKKSISLAGELRTIKDPLHFYINNPFEDIPRYIKTQTNRMYKNQDLARRMVAKGWQMSPAGLMKTAADLFLESELAENLRIFTEGRMEIGKGVKPKPLGAEILPNLVWNSAQFMASLPEFGASVVADPLGTAKGMLQAAVYQARLVSRMLKNDQEAWREFNQRPIDTVIMFMIGRGLMKKVGKGKAVKYEPAKLSSDVRVRELKKLDADIEALPENLKTLDYGKEGFVYPKPTILEKLPEQVNELNMLERDWLDMRKATGETPRITEVLDNINTLRTRLLAGESIEGLPEVRSPFLTPEGGLKIVRGKTGERPVDLSDKIKDMEKLLEEYKGKKGKAVVAEVKQLKEDISTVKAQMEKWKSEAEVTPKAKPAAKPEAGLDLYRVVLRKPGHKARHFKNIEASSVDAAIWKVRGDPKNKAKDWKAKASLETEIKKPKLTKEEKLIEAEIESRYRAQYSESMTNRVSQLGGLRPYKKSKATGKRPEWEEFNDAVPLRLRRKAGGTEGSPVDEMIDMLGISENELFSGLRADKNMKSKIRHEVESEIRNYKEVSERETQYTDFEVELFEAEAKEFEAEAFEYRPEFRDVQKVERKIKPVGRETEKFKLELTPDEALAIEAKGRADIKKWQKKIDDLNAKRKEAVTDTEYDAITKEINYIKKQMKDVVDTQRDMFKAEAKPKAKAKTFFEGEGGYIQIPTKAEFEAAMERLDRGAERMREALGKAKVGERREEIKVDTKVKPQVDRIVGEGKAVEQARIEAAGGEAAKAGRVVQEAWKVKLSKVTDNLIKRAKPLPEIKGGVNVAIEAMKEHDRWIRDAEWTSKELKQFGEKYIPKDRQMLMVHAYEHKMKGKYWDQLTPKEQNIVRYIAEEKAKLNKFIDDNEILERMEEKNINHIFHHWINPKSGVPYKAMYGKFSKGLPQAKQRYISTYEAGIKQGLTPATTNPFELIGLEWESAARAYNTRRLVQTLHNIGAEKSVSIQPIPGKPVKPIRMVERWDLLEKQGLTDSYERYSHYALDKAMTFKTADGTLVRMKGAIGIRKELYPFVKAYVESPNYVLYDQINFVSKSLKLGFSLFHVASLGAQEIANWRIPFKNIPRGLKARKNLDPDLRILYREGLDLFKGYEDIGYRNKFFDGESYMTKVGNTVTKPIEWMRTFIFDIVQPGMKTSFALDTYRKILPKYLEKGKTKEQAARDAVKAADGHFSHEHYKRSLLETNRWMVKTYFYPNARKWWQRALLSPTWQREHLLVVKNVAKSFLPDKLIKKIRFLEEIGPIKKEYRKYAAGALAMITAVDMYNLMATQAMDGEAKHIWENPKGKGFSVRAMWNEPSYTIVDKNGKTRTIPGGAAYFRPLKSVFEVAEWVKDPLKKMAYKLSPMFTAIGKQLFPTKYRREYEGWGDMPRRIRDITMDVASPIQADQMISHAKGKKSLPSATIPFIGFPTSVERKKETGRQGRPPRPSR